ncbi:MAG: thiopurine S-methyltransferase [Pseudomonadota bacterium]
MEPDFWHERWQDGRIGFHQAEVNKLLMKHWPTVCPDERARVFVPLCGKSIDMTWLAERGHDVVGVELSELAARNYFSERGLIPGETRTDHHLVLSGGGVQIYVGDYFKLPATVTKPAKAIFDRASLIALPTELRAQYASYLADITDAETRSLLLTITYPDGEIVGPPFSVTDANVIELFARDFDVAHKETRDATSSSKNLTDRGATGVATSVFVLTRRGAAE